MKNTYAIVDIETTGTDPKTDRIIQFGCVLVENGEIVSRFATDINPDQRISSQIQHLTGISNQRVAKAPYFEDVAVTIANFLSDTIFVAHNIYFDYTFLSNELVRCGLPELTSPGIDTVELAQIFMPTALSFRLKDLAEELAFSHKNPHQADSDAEVTAELLINLEKRIRQLPLITLEQIVKLADHMAFQTKDYLAEILADRKQQQETPSAEIEIIFGLALKKKTAPLYLENLYQRSYPRMKKNKEKLYGQKLSFRKEQGRLMNLVYDFFNSQEKADLIVEAATGIGKTLGYLLPMSYLATPENPLVVSTASLLLQEQMLNKDLPLLNELLEQQLQAVVMKSSRHYIDLARFYQTLQGEIGQKQYTFYQMAVLVWLTMTETGDFDELNMTRLNHTFWQEVGHLGLESLNPSNPFYAVDFLVQRNKKLQQSNLVITNHAFLAEESYRKTPQLPSSSYLIIDEAHHLSRTLTRISSHQLSVTAISKRYQQLLETNKILTWQNLVNHDQQISHLIEMLFDIYSELVADLTDLFPEMIRLTKDDIKVLSQDQFDQVSNYGQDLISRIQILYRDISIVTEKIAAYFQLHQASFGIEEQSDVHDFLALKEKLNSEGETFDQFVTFWEARYLHWLEEKSQRIAVEDLAAQVLPETRWYSRYQQILYLGGTLKITSDRRYFAKRWGIDADLKVIASPYDYSQQARLYVPNDSLDIQTASPERYGQYIAEIIGQVAAKEVRPILVLFTSHDILNRVYRYLRLPMLQENREILAQGSGGSREKLLKRFLLSEDAILLGADSFWEGIDLPGEILQVLIVTRLPFENPKRPLVKARNEYLTNLGVNSFYEEAIPHTILRLRQALGRLIRSEEDKGVMFLLDQRFIKASYGKRLQKALPKELPIINHSFADNLADAHDFLNSDKNSEK
ncbi:helicase C-terminal domain-containing protein [Enterococcus alishanensis]